MSKAIKNQAQILSKFGITELNEMQLRAQEAILLKPEVIILSPTGTGKTLAFLLPIIEQLDQDTATIQVLILVPARELALQIEQVVRDMGTGHKCNALYGGRAASKDKLDLQHPPAILIGTPGRIAHHIRRESFDTDDIRFLVLDEFDKSLEIGFEEEMEEILDDLRGVRKKILTSATDGIDIPRFVGLSNPTKIDFLAGHKINLKLKLIESPDKDKLETLYKAICHLKGQPGIVFLNFKDSIQRVSDYLKEKNISHGCFYGGLEQNDRERALIKFRNGSHQLLLATDLAARGIDVPEIKYIIHYHLPHRAEEFTHRNGRTARMQAAGTAFVMKWSEEELPDFIPELEKETLIETEPPSPSEWTTLFVSGGRKDKISKGDIAGLFFKEGELKKDELGVIELKQDCAFVGVKKNKADHLIKHLNNNKIKKRKIRVYEIE